MKGRGARRYEGDRRTRGPTALALFIPKLTRPALRGFSRAEAALLNDWEEIVGRQIALYTQPVKLTFPERRRRLNATLHLRVDPSMALDLQHSSDLLAERVNAYFGYSLVQGLRLRQVPLHRKQQPAPLRRSPGSGGKGAEASQERFSMIEDSDLRKALQRLADAVDTAGSGERL